MRKSSLLSCLIILCACDFIQSQEKTDSTYSRDAIPYELHNPDLKLELSGELEEISGLTFSKGNLAAVNDENGIVFLLSDQGKILKEIKFGGGGDYEGVEIIDDQFFIIESDGDIFKTGPSGTTDEIETPLNGDNDVEGLAYDLQKKRLLIANKDDAGINEKIEGRAVYSFDIETHQLSREPLFILNTDKINQRMMERKSDFKIKNFAPSGIAIHPRTKDIYIISHQGKGLVVLDSSFRLKEVVRLSRMFRQPEGICFSPEGDLFISSEGRGGVANILVFHYDR